MVFNDFKEVISTDVLIIGAGGAGLRAAIEASDNDAKVFVVCKGKFTETGSTFFPLMPHWGIQFLKEEKNKNTYDYFFKEILEVGEGMALPGLAKILVEQTPDRIRDLEEMGIRFQKINGDFYDYLSCFAKVKRPTADVFDIDNIRNIFKKEIIKRKIKVLEDFNIIEILVVEEGNNRRVCGAVGIDENCSLILIKTKSIILASGGGSIIFKHNMNSHELTGDGYELALNAGASLINMEYIQYIYGIIMPKKIHFTEKVFMYNPPVLNSLGETFLKRYIPQNLSEIDVISKRVEHGPFSSSLISKHYDIAVFLERREGRGTKNDGIFLDLRELHKHISDIEKEFPGTNSWLKWLLNKGVDVQKEPIEIALCAHANNGGLYVNTDTMSELDGLFACGEIMGGPHGADRQGGNMMAATQVFGKIAGENAAKYSKNFHQAEINENDILLKINRKIKSGKSRNQDYRKIKNEIQNATNKELVICRRGEGLKKLIKKLNHLNEVITLNKITKASDIKNYFNLKSMTNTALIISNAALMRRESRGSHHREDYPEKNNKEFRKIINIKRENNKNIYKFIQSPS